jgi:hypothetical protein
MRNLTTWQGIKAAIRADTITLTSFEIGILAFMAFSRSLFSPPLKPADPVYWFLMQLAMIAGFATAFPANWWLLKKGLKEPM